jgi:hypothetical protein
VLEGIYEIRIPLDPVGELVLAHDGNCTDVWLSGVPGELETKDRLSTGYLLCLKGGSQGHLCAALSFWREGSNVRLWRHGICAGTCSARSLVLATAMVKRYADQCTEEHRESLKRGDVREDILRLDAELRAISERQEAERSE